MSNLEKAMIAATVLLAIVAGFLLFIPDEGGNSGADWLAPADLEDRRGWRADVRPLERWACFLDE